MEGRENQSVSATERKASEQVRKCNMFVTSWTVKRRGCGSERGAELLLESDKRQMLLIMSDVLESSMNHLTFSD